MGSLHPDSRKQISGETFAEQPRGPTAAGERFKHTKCKRHHAAATSKKGHLGKRFGKGTRKGELRREVQFSEKGKAESRTFSSSGNYLKNKYS